MVDVVNLHAVFLVFHQLYDENGNNSNSLRGLGAYDVTAHLSFI